MEKEFGAGCRALRESSGFYARTLEAERGEIDLIDGLEDLAADAGGEELCFFGVEERCRWGGVAQEIGFERPVRGVAPRAGELCGSGELAVVGGIVEVGVVVVRDGSDRTTVEEIVQDVGAPFTGATRRSARERQPGRSSSRLPPPSS